MPGRAEHVPECDDCGVPLTPFLWPLAPPGADGFSGVEGAALPLWRCPLCRHMEDVGTYEMRAWTARMAEILTPAGEGVA